MQYNDKIGLKYSRKKNVWNRSIDENKHEILLECWKLLKLMGVHGGLLDSSFLCCMKCFIIKWFFKNSFSHRAKGNQWNINIFIDKSTLNHSKHILNLWQDSWQTQNRQLDDTSPWWLVGNYCLSINADLTPCLFFRWSHLIVQNAVSWRELYWGYLVHDDSPFSGNSSNAQRWYCAWPQLIDLELYT